MTGKIKYWNAEKGFGFIAVEGQNEDFFCHVSDVSFLPEAGDVVEFEIGQRNNRVLAVKVEFLSSKDNGNRGNNETGSESDS